jgi:hypothetical protein
LFRENAKHLGGNMSRGQRGNGTVVIRRRNFDDIHSNDVHREQCAQDREGLGCGERPPDTGVPVPGA